MKMNTKVVLNSATAMEYVLKHLTDLGYEDIRIEKVERRKEKGCSPMMVVAFKFRSENSESGDYEGGFDVWIEGGKIYGEW